MESFAETSQYGARHGLADHDMAESLARMSNHSTTEATNGDSEQNGSNGFGDHMPLIDDEQDRLEPIAVIGLGVKLPQDASSQESFWQMLLDGRSAMTEVPKNRMNIDAYYHPDKRHVGTMNIRGGHFIKEDIECFDAPFFSMNPMEAASLDPQQRCLLETTYQALENAGIPLEKAMGSNTSVHVGSFHHDHELLISRDAEMQVPYKNTGTLQALLANRLSWFYNFTGPSITLDTACSSTLHALHLSCQSLRLRESTMGIVAGSNLIYDPQSMVGMADLGFLSPDNICRTFDHRANGYSRGEGVAVVVVKPLSLALQDGDIVRAVIRSTGLNQDGRTPGGITQPSSAAQEQLIRQVYKNGGLSMARTRYFEAHGTGTPLGDFIETSAISAAFQDVKRDAPLIVGGVKTNIGHLEATSGLAGLIKAILVLERGLIPPNINFQRLSPKIKADEWNLQFPLTVMPWPDAGVRRASVNSFGLGGANAHAVLDDAYHYMKARKISGRHTTRVNGETCSLTSGSLSPEGLLNNNGIRQPIVRKKPSLFVWSAADEHGIKRLADAYGAHFGTMKAVQPDDAYLDNLAYTLSEKRSHLLWRSFTIASSLDELCSKMEQLPSHSMRSDPRRLAFVFTGQGAQWHAMGRELFAYEAFRTSIKAADDVLLKLNSDWSLEAELGKDKDLSRVDDPAVSQALCVALQIALVDLLRSWMVVPSAVVGHSSGEIAAAYCAGAISLESAIRIAFYRGVIVSQLRKSQPWPCGMMAIGLPATRVQQYLDKISEDACDGEISIACINSPNNVTVAGSIKHIDTLKALLDTENIFARKLNVDVAYHSRYMMAGAGPYRNLLDKLEAGPCGGTYPPMVSSVTGELVSNAEVQKAEYWTQNLVNQINFSGAVSYMTSPAFAHTQCWTDEGPNQIDCFLEIGPHSALRSPLREILTETRPGLPLYYQSILRRDQSALDTALEAMGTLHCLGLSVDISKVNGFGSAREVGLLTDLPPYPFNHTKKYWHESRLSKNIRFREFPRHDLLGSPVPDWNPLQAKWRNYIRPGEDPWVAGHKVNGLDVCPAAGMLVMAMEALRQVSKSRARIRAYRFREVVFSRALSVSPEAQNLEVEVEFHLRRPQDSSGKLSSWSEFSLYMLDNEDWAECCRGSISSEYHEVTTSEAAWVDHSDSSHDELSTGDIKRFDTCDRHLDSKQLYEYLSAMGLAYGPTFRSLQEIQHDNAGKTTAVANLQHWKQELPEASLVPHAIHPAALDAIFQLIVPALSRGCRDKIPTLVPTRLDSLWISDALSSASDPQVRIFTEVKSEGFRNVKASAVAVHVASGKPCISASWHTSAVASLENSSTKGNTHQRLCYHIDTKPDLDLLDRTEVERWCSTDQDLYIPDDTMTRKRDALCYLAMSRLSDSFSGRESTLEKAELRHYLDWARSCLAAAKNASTESWIGRRNHSVYFNTLLEEVRVSGPEGRLLARVASNLNRIFRGELTAVDLLFSDNSLEDMYSQGLGVPHVFQQTARYIDALSHKNPALRVLEIGAGTGSGTARIIDALANHPGQKSGVFRFAEYCYTDISPGFLQRGREKFSTYAEAGQMTFAVLDIEKDPLQQNFEPEAYDLIVALNVIHATTSIQNSLKNARKLLRPGGHIILIEITGAHLMQLEFVFGLFSGWWLSTEEHRKKGPLMSEEWWHTHLKESGFSGVDAALRNHQHERCHVYSAMISTATGELCENLPLENIAIVVDQHSHQQMALAASLKEHYTGRGCRIVPLSDITADSVASTNYIFLPEIDGPLLYGISDSNFSLLQKVFASCKSFLWVSDGADSSPFTSLIRGVLSAYRAENESLSFAMFSLADGCVGPSTVANIAKVMDSMREGPPALAEAEYIERDGLIHISRVLETNAVNKHIIQDSAECKPEPRMFGQKPMRALELGFGHPGLLNTLQFSDDLQAQDPLQTDEIEIAVKYSGVNFRDLLTALGQLNDTTLGLEASGVVTRAGVESGFAAGDRVCALLLGSFRTYGRCNAKLARHIPENVDLQSAAALPVIFCTAYHALVNLAHLRQGESVLIHSGAGGLGQAAIQLAQLFGAEIFVTVGTEEKRQLLIDLYKINPSHIFSSRSVAFAQRIKKLTNGRGVDVVVNSLAGERLRASWECIAPFGRFVETGMKDINTFGSLPMASFADDTMFASMNLVNIMRRKPGMAGQLMESILELAADSKIFAPRPLQVYRLGQLEDSLRLMQSGRNSGKMVIEFGEDDIVPTLLSSLPTYNLKSDVSYLIAGGLGGLGRTVARWMVSRGARHLILLSWTKKEDADTLRFLDELKSAGASVATPICDISDKGSLAAILEEVNKTMPPIKGCIQAAMVLKNGKFDTMPKEDFDAVLKPKIDGSWNLHALLPRNLDFFILFSSLVGVAPCFGQANYAAGNAFQDALARYRISCGEKAVSIDIGMVVDAGFVAKNVGLAEQLAARGATPVYTEDILGLLEYYCNDSLPLLSPEESQVIIGLQTPAALRAQGIEEPYWLQRPVFSYLTRARGSVPAGSSSSADSNVAIDALGTLLPVATTLDAAAALVCDALATKLAKILVMDRADIHVNKPANAHGVDSLVAMELRQWFRKVVRADVATFEILGNTPMETLATKAAARSELLRVAVAA